MQQRLQLQPFPARPTPTAIPHSKRVPDVEPSREDIRLIASILSGSWRLSPSPPTGLSADQLTRVAPLLHTLGVAPLSWWRLRHSTLLRDHSVMLSLRDAFLHSRVHQTVLEKLLADGLRLLDEARINAILAKGPAIARCYAEAGLRPFNDVDLSVSADQYDRAAETVERIGHLHILFDLQPGFHGHIDRAASELEARARWIEIGGESVRVLGPEDHLRLLAHHALLDGVRLPVELVDLAAFLDTLPATFDWEYCMSGSPRRTEYLCLAVALAGEILDAPLTAVPSRWRPGPVPEWVVGAVLYQWQRTAMQPKRGGRLLRYMHSSSVRTGLRLWWPNPVRAAVWCEAPIGESPQLRWQIRTWLDRAADSPRRFIRRYQVSRRWKRTVATSGSRQRKEHA